jgi:hypothetical protein
MGDFVGWRWVRTPVTDAMLGPLEPECEAITLRTQLTDNQFALLAESMRLRPDVHLFVSECYDGTIRDLEFLRFFPWFDRFYVEVPSVESFAGLRYLPGLQQLSLGKTRRPLSLAPLAELTSLRRLEVDGPAKNYQALSALTDMRSLTLRSVTIPDLSVLTSMIGLRALDIKLGGTCDLTMLRAFEQLQYLELWMIRGFCDLNPVAAVPSLDTLFLESLKHVTELPDLSRMTSLRRVHLNSMTGLSDLTPLLTAPNLEELVLERMDHLDPERLAPLASHSTLRRAWLGLGSTNKDEAACAALPLAKADPSKGHPAFNP